MEKPDAIIVAMHKKFFEEYGMRRFLQDMKNMNTVDGFTWYRVMKNIPKIDVPYCYWIINGKIRFRMDVLRYFRNEDLAFSRPNGGMREFPKSNGIQLIGPVIKAPYKIEMKGFQGFRYSPLIF